MGLFNKSEEQKEFEIKVDNFKSKCNFLRTDGNCQLCESKLSEMECAFEDCIFMKMLKQGGIK